MNVSLSRTIFSAATVSIAIWASPGLAKTGDPVAIRHLAGGGLAIESMWNLSIVISRQTPETTQLDGVDLLLPGVTGADSSQKGGRFKVRAGSDGAIDHLLDRPANQPRPTWQPWSESTPVSDQAIRVRTVGAAKVVLIDVDGVRIAYRHLGAQAGPTAKDENRAMADADVVVLTTSGSADDLIKDVESNSLISGSATVIVCTDAHRAAVGNTVAVRANPPGQKAERQGQKAERQGQKAERRVVVLSSKPVELDQAWQTLFKNKEAACVASQKVFAKLSVDQMNFRPSNGSHTPRWNAEHMMGRELLFFSQIFSRQDPAIPVMDLNPKQMPPDYVARHAQWSGEEEARQMERVSAFTRRFAYLLKDLPLDQKAPGSGWTPRGLLRQMERHYNDHTANVKKKFELDDWPRE